VREKGGNNRTESCLQALNRRGAKKGEGKKGLTEDRQGSRGRRGENQKKGEGKRYRTSTVKIFKVTAVTVSLISFINRRFGRRK